MTRSKVKVKIMEIWKLWKWLISKCDSFANMHVIKRPVSNYDTPRQSKFCLYRFLTNIIYRHLASHDLLMRSRLSVPYGAYLYRVLHFAWWHVVAKHHNRSPVLQRVIVVNIVNCCEVMYGKCCVADCKHCCSSWLTESLGRVHSLYVVLIRCRLWIWFFPSVVWTRQLYTVTLSFIAHLPLDGR